MRQACLRDPELIHAVKGELIDTEIEIRGPARRHPAMRTSADPSGVLVKGTIGNCGSGRTPWGTYLTCEEDSHKNYFYTKDWAADDPRKTEPRHQRSANFLLRR